MMLRSQGTLRRQLLLPILLFQTISLFIAGVALVFVYQGFFEGMANLQNETAARAATDVEAYLEGIRIELVNAGLTGDLMDVGVTEQLRLLNRLQNRHESYVALAVVNRMGEQQIQTLARADTTPLPARWGSQPILQQALAGESPMGSIEYYAGIPHVLMAAPIRDSQLQVVGVIVAQIDLGTLWTVVAESGSGETGYVYVVDPLGRLIASRDMALVMEEPDIKEVESVQAILNDRQLEGSYSGLFGTGVVGGIDAVEGTDWMVVAELPTGEAFAYLQSLVPLVVVQVVVGLALAVVVWFYISDRVVNPVLMITRGAQYIGDGHLDHRLEIDVEGELGDLAHVLNSTAGQLEELIGSLEHRVAERTAALERRSVQLEAAAQVSREAATIRDVGQLLDEVVWLISDRFGFYHAGIFLLDEIGEYAVLRAASSDGGRHMLARGHKLKVGETGIVGYVAGMKEPRIALDVGADAVFFNNPDLPLTRSEMALPLIVRERVIGVLDVQSTEEAAFTKDDVSILQTMADQLAMAIENARLLEESQRALQELESLYGTRTREAWRRRVSERSVAYRYTGVSVETAPLPATKATALSSTRQPVGLQEPDGHRLVAPIRLRGQTLGSIVLRRVATERPWSQEELTLTGEVCAQIGLALENARLLEETQRRAEREQTLSDLTSRFSRSLDIDALLQTAVRELGQLLDVDEVSVHVGLEDGADPGDGAKGEQS